LLAPQFGSADCAISSALFREKTIAMKFLVIIRTFVCVVQLKGFSPAARELNIETSTVSRHVALLEQDLRVSLFNRSTHGLSLTEAGKLFYPGRWRCWSSGKKRAA
jgi:hypothetical protein